MTTGHASSISALPKEFIWRRLHSLTGLWLVLFLLEHLLVNSQAALFLGDYGQGFVRAVNAIHDLPYLSFIEMFLLGVPILVHLLWGLHYLFTSKSNSYKSDGSKPSLPEYGRNKAYSWQRITSWILLFALIAHVVKFRFLEYPWSADDGKQKQFFVKIEADQGLYALVDRLGVSIYDAKAIHKEASLLEGRKGEEALLDAARSPPAREGWDANQSIIVTAAEQYRHKIEWVKALQKESLKANEVLAASPSFGVVSLLTVRDTFKNPWYVALYTVFVLATCFHAFNGFWTFLITWGILLKMSAQKGGQKVALILMILVASLGLMAIWGTYLKI